MLIEVGGNIENIMLNDDGVPNDDELLYLIEKYMGYDCKALLDLYISNVNSIIEDLVSETEYLQDELDALMEKSGEED